MFEHLKTLAAQAVNTPILSRFDAVDRAADYSVTADEMLFDYSKTALDEEARAALVALFEGRGVAKKRDAMFRGDKINETEGRAVLHTALRNFGTDPIVVDGVDVLPEVRKTRAAMGAFAAAVRDGTFTGQGGKITDVVNIGIGGSDLGPAMATLALAPYCDGPRCHFVSNIDGAHIHDVLAPLNPETTLIIVASKTFTTIETMTNAQTARAWMASKVTNPADQFAALSSAVDRTGAFGITSERVFGFEDWVGGRYSIWGPIGLSLMISIGPERFEDFLKGAAAMDQHFQTAPVLQNMPVMLALVGIWHHQGLGYGTRAVLPYDQRLSRFAAYLQQMEMESNGKGVALNGDTLDYASGPVVWGEPGTNGQHAFYQLIHQGTAVIPCEFLVAAKAHEDDLQHHHNLLLANCFAQSEALMRGRSYEEELEIVTSKGIPPEDQDRQARHRVFVGNRPSTTLIYPKLTPFVLGQLIALYEHRVFVEGVILGINSYDQWGVELGKELATALGPIVEGKASAADKDGSTQQLIAYIENTRQT